MVGGRAPCTRRGSPPRSLASVTSPAPNARIVRRSWSACSGDDRNRSSSAARTRRCAPARRGAAEAIDAADDRDGDAGVLGHHQAARGGDLVGEGDLGRLERPAPVVGPSAEVDERGEPVGADRHVDHTRAPRAPERVGDDDGQVAHAAAATRAPRGAVARIASGSVGSRASEPASTLDASTPGVRAHEAVRGLGDHEVSATGDDAIGLGGDRRLGRSAVDEAALGLRHDLRGHDDDVAVAHAGGPQRRLEQRGEVVARSRPRARPATRQAPRRGGRGSAHHAGQHRRREALGASSSSRITVSVTTTRTPVRLDARRQVPDRARRSPTRPAGRRTPRRRRPP